MLSSQLSLDNFISDAIQWSPANWKGFTEEWKYRDVVKMLPKYRNHIDNVLAGTLNPKDHSLAYSYLLGYKSTEKMDDPAFVSNYLKQIRKFIKVADSRQVSIYPRPFTDALRIFVDFMKREKNYLALIPILKRCIRILQGSKNQNILTFAHCDLMYCCVETYCYHLCKPEINYDIIQVQGMIFISANLRK